MPDESSVGNPRATLSPPQQGMETLSETVRSLVAVGIENDRREERLGQIRARSFAEAAGLRRPRATSRVVCRFCAISVGRDGEYALAKMVWLARLSENDIDLEH